VNAVFHALSETGQVAAGGGGGAVFLFLVAFLIWSNSGGKSKAEKAKQAKQGKRRSEIEAVLRSWTLADRVVCRGVLDMLDAEDAAKNKGS
jgi:hypothetical protein